MAKFKLDVAQEQAKSTINVDYAKAAAAVAEAVCQGDADANNKVPNAVPRALVNQHLLEHRAAVLSIEKAQMEFRIAGLQAKVSDAELAQATEKVEHRSIKSPLTGQVQKINRHVGEWVQPGKALLHLVQVNQLRVQGTLKISEFAEEVMGRPVTISVVFARGRNESFTGEIVFVDPMVEADGQYLIRALIRTAKKTASGCSAPAWTPK